MGLLFVLVLELVRRDSCMIVFLVTFLLVSDDGLVVPALIFMSEEQNIDSLS